MKNYADRGGCYPPKSKAETDNILRDLHYSSYHTKAEFNNCFIIHSKYFQSSKNISLHNFLIGFCRVHGKITRYLKTMNKKQEKSDQQNFIQGSDKFAVRSKIRMNFLRVRSPRNTIWHPLAVIQFPPRTEKLHSFAFKIPRVI